MQDLAKRYYHITEQPLTASIEPRQCISIIDSYCSLMKNSLKNRRFKRLLSATIVDSIPHVWFELHSINLRQHRNE